MESRPSVLKLEAFDLLKIDIECAPATAISFSGGRTSGYMLDLILKAYGGRLPDNVHVLFANTGKERPETLDFVQECSTRFDVPVVWLEYDPDSKHKTRIVNHNSASRKGEPFDALIKSKQYLPNAVTRFCTTELKIMRFSAYMHHALGHDHWLSVIGFRADEMRRVTKLRPRNDAKKDKWWTVAPLADAGITKRDVMAFWAHQPFDLRLEPHEGNCDLCYLKGTKKLIEIMRTKPDTARWWIEKEANNMKSSSDAGRRFSKRWSYQELLDFAENQTVFDFMDDSPGMDCFCHD